MTGSVGFGTLEYVGSTVSIPKLVQKQDSRPSKGMQHICISHHVDYSLMEVLVSECSYFLIYHNMTRTMVSFI